MNGAAHYLSSVFITLFIYKLIPNSEIEDRSRKIIRMMIIFSISFFFHILIDNLAKLTYHPSESNWGDPVYAGWHLFTYILEAVVAIYILRKDLRYFGGMLGSVSFDLWDWSIVRFLGKYTNVELPTLHFMEGYTREAVFYWLPEWGLNPPAMINEIIFIILMLLSWFKLERKWPMHGSLPGTKKSITFIILLFGAWRLMSLL